MSTSDVRTSAAVAHLGFPCCGPLLPLVMLLTGVSHPHRIAHARQALAFQLCFLAAWAVVSASVVVLGAPDALWAVAGAIGLACEVPQMVRALADKPPLRIVPDGWVAVGELS